MFCGYALPSGFGAGRVARIPRRTPATTRGGLYAYRAALLAAASIGCGARTLLPDQEGADGSAFDAGTGDGAGSDATEELTATLYGLAPEDAAFPDARPFDAGAIPDAGRPADAREEHPIVVPYGVPPK